MSFEKVMTAVSQWTTATEALAALGAQLALAERGATAPAELDSALRAVVEAAGLDGLDELAPPQRAMALAFIRETLHWSDDLVAEPDRSPGWSFTDPHILDGWGRGSSMVPVLIAASHPDLADVHSFLDVGTGVGLLAVAAAGVWPASRIVGIDVWTPSLERARANVDGAGLGDRITLRQQDIAELDDAGAYDCVWLPSFFMTEPVIVQALPAILAALQPGGWLALGRFRTAPDPVAQAVSTLRTIRSGGSDLDTKQAVDLVEQAGFESVHTFEPPGPAPLELVLGQRAPS